MDCYKYVTKKTYSPTKHDIIALIYKVQQYLRHSCSFRFRFDFRFIGSAKRNMITMNEKSNIGYDFDLDLRVHTRKRILTPSEYKHILMDAFNQCVHNFGYDYCEDNTRVFTIKKKDKINSKIIHSCDFAIVHDTDDGRIEYIRHNRENNSYFWDLQSIYPHELKRRIIFIKHLNLWNDVKSLYLQKKNENKDPTIKSRSIFSQTINQIYLKNSNQ